MLKSVLAIIVALAAASAQARPLHLQPGDYMLTNPRLIAKVLSTPAISMNGRGKCYTRLQEIAFHELLYKGYRLSSLGVTVAADNSNFTLNYIVSGPDGKPVNYGFEDCQWLPSAR